MWSGMAPLPRSSPDFLRSALWGAAVYCRKDSLSSAADPTTRVGPFDTLSESGRLQMLQYPRRPDISWELLTMTGKARAAQYGLGGSGAARKRLASF